MHCDVLSLRLGVCACGLIIGVVNLELFFMFQTDGNTAFLRAARSGNLEKVLEFINANVDINTSNSVSMSL